MPTRFMRLFGHDTVTVAATTRINREVRQMELALVLDNTGSMWGTPFTTMQAAAKDLVDIVYGEEDTSPNLFVAVVPYVATVNMGNWRTDWLAAGDPARGPGNPYAPSTWKGCVMARTGGLDRTDDPPATAPFRSYLYPDASDNDWGAPRNPRTDERLNARNDAYGPNLGCGPPILSLVQSRATVDAALDGMGAWSRGGTSGNEGLGLGLARAFAAVAGVVGWRHSGRSAARLRRRRYRQGGRHAHRWQQRGVRLAVQVERRDSRRPTAARRTTDQMDRITPPSVG